MKRFGQIIGVRAEKLDYYKQLHAKPWPEVLDMIRQCNIRNYSIYQFRDMLFAYFEYVGSDFDADMDKMAADPMTRKWWGETDPCQFALIEGEKWISMEEVFHAD